jgi:CRP-like cAMP-binding protein/di/tricarboxylate transporter
MSSPATALARSPLFSQLGRLDLARLAGELEECRYPAGAVIVRQGDPADGLYVINSGHVSIVVGGNETRDGHAVNLLGPGEEFGEMALLTDSPRSATVVAHTEVTVWRLSRARFDTLLTQEPAIARAIERALSHRLAILSREVAELHGVGRALAERATGALSPMARALMPALFTRRRWPAEVLRRVAERTATTKALAELCMLPGFMREDGTDLLVDAAFGALAGKQTEGAVSADAAWLVAAAEELAAAGDLVGAADLECHARAFDRLAQRLTDDDRLIEACSVADLERWIAHAGPTAPGLADQLTALRGRLGAALAESAPLERRAPITTLVRRLSTARFLGAVTALAVFVAACLMPVPPGLSREGLVTLGAIVATVPLLVCGVLPDFVVMLLLSVTLVVPGLVTARDALAGFATPAWIMSVALLALGTAVSRSGLMFRLVLLSLQRLPPRFLNQSLVLCGAGVLLSAGLPGGATRIALGVPIGRGIVDAMGFAPRSPGAAAVGLLIFFTFLQMGELFLTGTFTGLLIHDLLPVAARADITWWKWFLVALPPFAMIFALTYATLLLLFKPHRAARVNLKAVRVQQELLGRLTRAEIWSAVALAGLIVGFATRQYHGIAPAWLAVGVFLMLFMVGVLDQNALQSGGGLGLLVYFGLLLSLGNIFAALRIDEWLTGMVRGGMPGLVANPYGFVLVVAAIAFGLHFFVPSMTASILLALVTMPIAEGLGFHPFIAVLVVLIAGNHTVVPYVTPGYLMLYFASEGELFTHAQARLPLALESFYRWLALLVSVPVWRLAGLL